MQQWMAQPEILTGKNGTFQIRVQSVIFVEVQGHLVTYHTTIGDIVVRQSLSEAERTLPQERFARCAQSYLVHLAYARYCDGILYANHIPVPVSRAYKRSFLARLAQFRQQENA